MLRLLWLEVKADMSIFKSNSDAAKKKQVSDEDTKKVYENTNSAAESKEFETSSEQGGIGKLLDKAKLVMKSTLKNTSEHVRKSDSPKKRKSLERNKSKSDEEESFVDINETSLEALFGCEEMDAFIYTSKQVTQCTSADKEKYVKSGEPITRKEFSKQVFFEGKGKTVIQGEPESDVFSEKQGDHVSSIESGGISEEQESYEDSIENDGTSAKKKEPENRDISTDRKEVETKGISALKRELASQSIPQDKKRLEDECILAETKSESQSIKECESNPSAQGELVKNQKLGSTSEAIDSRKSISKDEEELQDELIAKDQNSNLVGTATGIKQVSKSFAPLKRYKPMKDTKLTIIFLENTSEVASQIDNLNKIVKSVKNGFVCIVNYGSRVMQTELFEAADIKNCELLVEGDVGDKACLFNALVALENIVFNSYYKVLETEYERMRIKKIEVIGIGRCVDNCSTVSKEIGMEYFSRITKNPNIVTKYFTLTEESFIQVATIGFRSIGAIYRNYM